MKQEIDTGKLLVELAKLQQDMDFVRGHIEDATLTLHDLETLEEAEREYEKGRTTTLEKLKDKLRL